MPYNLFFTVRRSNEFSKAKAMFTGQAGEAEHVFTIEDPEWMDPHDVLTILLGAVKEHMEVRRANQRRG